jgi:hypothetical protein
MSPFKVSVRDAESLLVEISDNARDRQPLLGPAVVAQEVGLVASILSFLALTFLFVACVRRLPAVSHA